MTDEKLTRSESIAILVHYYRAEVQRSLAWRERLDRTTNWAVAGTAAFLGFGFSHPEIPHLFFLFGLTILYLLLFIEARRFRFYDAYEYRVRLMNQNMIYSVLSQGTLPADPLGDEGMFWRAELASDLRFPQYKMSLVDAINKRLRANYIYLFLVMAAGWILKLASHPRNVENWQDFLTHARVGPIPGELTLLFLLAFLLHLFYLARRIGHPSGGREIIHPHH
jgi:uncharacterized membrane protein